ncbi:cell division protein FtsQ [Mordavella massiliensis]|jgi:riboflavin transporter FmnP|uniref:Cell division protein FtsQ n=1 Tax=Mordavella massiliensis TaxID=1871024 RepID=A0A938XEK7_9CLOT|nr:cell division protein FtsQ [Mordavella massiliensis]MBM6827087.1 cell division protein FtsQ [Mordavella massiliensis]MBM6969467.1 cell division protein FtsQ [Mordavella massiliensis]HJB86588.1 cell division protein FtsQ [Candidatus Dorea faecigallinarum]
MNAKNKMTQSQKMMVFVLTMSLYGLATLFTELIPSFQVGIVEFSVEYFLFIPLTLAMLFDPLSAALGAATGELVFSEIMLGQFGGLGELEKFLTVTIGVYIAGRIVKDPRNRKVVAAASIIGVAVQQFMGCVVDILKVQFAVEDFEAVAGLPESVFFTEGFACLNDILFSGILFCMLPTMYLAPRLYGKIEPLLGVKPRDKDTMIAGDYVLTPKMVGMVLIGFAAAIASELLASGGYELIDWEAAWAGNTTSIIIGIIVAAIIALIVIGMIRGRAVKNAETKQA